MKKIICLAAVLLLSVLCCAAMAETKTVRVEMTPAVMEQLVPDAAYGVTAGSKIDLRDYVADSEKIIRIRRTGRLLIRNNPINLWGIPQEDGSVAVAELSFDDELYIYVTSKLGDGLIPLTMTTVTDMDKAAFDDTFKNTRGRYEKKKVPGDPTDPTGPSSPAVSISPKK